MQFGFGTCARKVAHASDSPGRLLKTPTAGANPAPSPSLSRPVSRPGMQPKICICFPGEADAAGLEAIL